MAKRGRDAFQKYKPLILGMAKFFMLFPKSFRIKLLVFFRKTTGRKGLALRYALLKTVAKTCGNNVSIHPDVYLFSPSQLTIGDNVSIHPMCYIDATGGIEIGNDVSIAHATTILSTTHTFDRQDIPIKDQTVKILPTKIEDDVWLGAKVTVLGGTTIRSGCIVGAGSVVTKDTHEKSVYVGVPAKKIKERQSQ